MPAPGPQPTSLMQDYLRILQRRAWVVVTTAAILAGGVLLLSLRQEPVYQATSKVLLQPKVSETLGSSDLAVLLASVAGDATELEVMQSRLVKDAVADELGYVPSVSLTSVENTHVVNVRARADEGVKAARDANTYARVYVKERRESLIEELNGAIVTFEERLAVTQAEISQAEAPLRELDGRLAATGEPEELLALERERTSLVADLDRSLSSVRARAAAYQGQIDQLRLTSTLTVTGGAQVISEAATPADPVAPTPIRSTAIALVVGVLLGVAMVFVVHQLDDRIRSKIALDAVTDGLPTLGIIPFVASPKGHPNRLVAAASHSPAWEAYRGLWTSLRFPALDTDVRSIQITSANPGEGKTTTVANLALTLAQAGKRVVMLDGDLRQPGLASLFGIEPRVGLAEVLLGDVELSEALVEVPDEPRLAMVAIAGGREDPPELLGLQQFRALIETLRAESDFVIVDTPPVLPVADGLAVSSAVDATVLVVAAERTKSKQVERALELLRQVDATLLGTVLNMAPVRRRSDTYGYGYGYGADHRPSRLRRLLRLLRRRPWRKDSQRAGSGARRRGGGRPDGMDTAVRRGDVQEPASSS